MKPLYKAIAICVLSLPLTTVVHAAATVKKAAPAATAVHHDVAKEKHEERMKEMMNPEHLKKIQENFLQMHDLSNKILAETDSAKQQALKDQQLALMKEHMEKHMMGGHHWGHEGSKEKHEEMMKEMTSPEHLQKIQVHELQMHDLSNRILAETDPTKQQALKDQQLELMKAEMQERMAKHHHQHTDHADKEKPASSKEATKK